MNIFSHFYFDHVPERFYLNTGLVLPDFMGMTHRKWKLPQDLPHRGPFNQTPENGLWEGCLKHLRTDAFFHESKYFKHKTTELSRELEASGVKNPPYRLFFISHILLELLIDRYLIKSEKELLNAFYENLYEVDHSDYKQFFNRIDSGMPQRFNEFLFHFKEKKYLFSYLNDESLIYALNRIFERAGQPTWNDTLKQRVLERFHIFDAIIANGFNDLHEQKHEFEKLS